MFTYFFIRYFRVYKILNDGVIASFIVYDFIFHCVVYISTKAGRNTSSPLFESLKNRTAEVVMNCALKVSPHEWDRQTDKQTDKQTDRHDEIIIWMSLNQAYA